MTTLHDFGSALGRPLDTSFGLSRFHGQALGSCAKWPLGPLYMRMDPKNGMNPPSVTCEPVEFEK